METQQTNQSKNNYVLNLLANINNYNHYLGLYAVRIRAADLILDELDKMPDDKAKGKEELADIQKECAVVINEMIYNALQCKLLLKPTMEDKDKDFIEKLDTTYKEAFESEAFPVMSKCEAYGVLINKFCTQKLAKDILDSSEDDIKNFIK